MKNKELTKALKAYKNTILIERVFHEENNVNTREKMRYKLRNGNWTVLELKQIDAFIKERQVIINNLIK